MHHICAVSGDTVLPWRVYGLWLWCYMVLGAGASQGMFLFGDCNKFWQNSSDFWFPGHVSAAISITSSQILVLYQSLFVLHPLDVHRFCLIQPSHLNHRTRARDLQRCDAVLGGASSLRRSRVGCLPRKPLGDRHAPAVGRALRPSSKGRRRPARRRTALCQLRRWRHSGARKPFYPWRRAHSQLQCWSWWMLGLKVEPQAELWGIDFWDTDN